MTLRISSVRKLFKARIKERSEPRYTLRPAMPTGTPAAFGGIARSLRELCVHELIASTPTTFCRPGATPGAARILVLGNCQAPNLARHIASGCEASVLGVEMMNYRKFSRAFDILCEESDIIVTHQLSDIFRTISTAHLKDRYSNAKKIYTHTAVHFTGDHPDIVYLGTMGKRAQSPMGDYHSRITLRSFIAGESEEDCLKAFNEQTFAELGYFEAAEESFREWERREADADLRSCAFARDIWRDEQLMITINHPRSRLLKHVSDQFLRAEGLPPADYDHELTPNLLLTGPIWPVHSLLMKHHGKTHATPSLMWNRGKALSHAEFVRRSYAMYRKVGRDALLAAATGDQQTNVLGVTRNK